MARTPPSGVIAALLAILSAGCGTIDPGDNIVGPDVQLSEDFFFCVIEPQVLQAYSCAGGQAGEDGMCHTSRSAMRLIDTRTVTAPTCDGDRPTSPVPVEYMSNYQAVQFAVQTEPGDSPLYLRPLGEESHPRVIFPSAMDTGADLIAQWISQGGL